MSSTSDVIVNTIQDSFCSDKDRCVRRELRTWSESDGELRKICRGCVIDKLLTVFEDWPVATVDKAIEEYYEK